MLTGIFTFLANSAPYTSKKNNQTYFKATFMAQNGKILELSVSTPLPFEMLTKHILVVDIIQGKYPQFNLVSHELAK